MPAIERNLADARAAASAELNACPGALVFASRDADTLIASLPTHDMAVASAVSAFRKGLEGEDQVGRLALTRDAIAKFGAMVADREKERADAQRFIAEQRRAAAQGAYDRQQAEARSHRALRMSHPIFCTLTSRLDAIRGSFNTAVTPADFNAILEDMHGAFRSATTGLTVAIASLSEGA